jgi:anti-anti-sigma factor
MNASTEETNMVLHFGEALTSTTVLSLRLQFLSLLGQCSGVETITADLSRVPMIDSQGLNLLIGMYQDAREKGLSFRITGASEANRRLFALVNLQDYIPLG